MISQNVLAWGTEYRVQMQSTDYRFLVTPSFWVSRHFETKRISNFESCSNMKIIFKKQSEILGLFFVSPGRWPMTNAIKESSTSEATGWPRCWGRSWRGSSVWFSGELVPVSILSDKTTAQLCVIWQSRIVRSVKTSVKLIVLLPI